VPYYLDLIWNIYLELEDEYIWNKQTNWCIMQLYQSRQMVESGIGFSIWKLFTGMNNFNKPETRQKSIF